MLVAIDGPAGSGKSSVARRVARRMGVVDLNTGAIYRAVALLALEEGIDLGDGRRLAAAARRVGLGGEGALLDGAPLAEEELRRPEVSGAASRVSEHPEVRRVLLAAQREAAERARARGGAVVEGRDIGTVVLPDAELKVFLVAAPEERARRRARQTGRGEEIERIREAIDSRDRRDSEREASPLKVAPDAVVLDTTTLSLQEVVERVLELAREHAARGGGGAS